MGQIVRVAEPMQETAELTWDMIAENRPSVRIDMSQVPTRARLSISASPLSMLRAVPARITTDPRRYSSGTAR